jgi:SAM-dependent methyltransferase
MLNTSQLTRVALKIIGKYKGKLGEIAIWESERTGDRLYREGEIFQSQSSASGESRFPYVKIMEAFLGDANSVLLLGCGGGNLATMLARQGKSVTVVDHNPVSFDLAKRFFGLPKEIPCIVADFREYLLAETRIFDGIAIDVGGPGFCFEEQFDPATCHSITARAETQRTRNPEHACRNRFRRGARHDQQRPVRRSHDFMDIRPSGSSKPKCPHRVPAEAAPSR